MIEQISIIGCGGHARSVADVLINSNPSIDIVFYDKKASLEEKMFGRYEIFPICDKYKYKDVFVAIGNNLERKEYVERCSSTTNFKFSNVISQMSYISPFSTVNEGTYIANGVHIGPEVQVGRFVILNTNAVIEHEVIIGDYSHISVNTTVCGRTEIGNNVFIGAGAVVKDKLHICDDVIIGAGGVVCSDITEPGTYVGCPVRRVLKK